MKNKTIWIVQVYDENGKACKLPRRFKGTRKEVEQYCDDRFGLVDAIFDRTTIAYDSRDGYNYDNIPQYLGDDSEK